MVNLRELCIVSFLFVPVREAISFVSHCLTGIFNIIRGYYYLIEMCV